MGFASEIGKSPKVAFVLISVLALGVLLNLIGFASPHWGQYAELGYTLYSDLWRLCQVTQLGTVCVTFSALEGKDAAVQAMMVLGMLASVSAGGLLLMFLVTSQLKTRNIATLILWACIAAAVFNVIGIAIFAEEYSKALNITDLITLEWAFYLCVVGTVLFVLCSVLAGLLRSQMESSASIQIQ